MLENDEDVVHAGIVSKSQNIPNSGRFWNSQPTPGSGSGLAASKIGLMLAALLVASVRRLIQKAL